MKRFFKLFLVVLCLSVFIPGVVPSLGIECVEAAQKIKLNYTKKTIYEGDSFKLKISGTKKKVKWTSSNKKVATVSSKGVVKGKSGGDDKKTCKITAAVGGKKYMCKVTVKAVPKEEEDVDESDDANENNNASDSEPSNDIAKNIAAVKDYIQKNGYTNANGGKTIRGLEGAYTPVIAYEKETDVLNFIMFGESELTTTINMKISSLDNSMPIDVTFLCAGKGFSFTAIGTIIPSEYFTEKECNFTFKYNNSPLSESDIQEISNSMLKLAFVEWNYTLKANANLTMKDIGFTEVTN